MDYLLIMEKTDWKGVLWRNVKARMNDLYGKENLSRLIKESGVGPGTVTRIKEQGTSVGMDVLEKVATALKTEPWQLIHPDLGESRLPTQIATAPAAVASLEQITEALAGYFEGMDANTRKMAVVLLGQLADDPKDHSRIAAMIDLSIRSKNRKAA